MLRFEHVVEPLRVTVDVVDRSIEISLQVDIRAHRRSGQNLVRELGARRNESPVSNQQLAARSSKGDLPVQQSLSVRFLRTGRITLSRIRPVSGCQSTSKYRAVGLEGPSRSNCRHRTLCAGSAAMRFGTTSRITPTVRLCLTRYSADAIRHKPPSWGSIVVWSTMSCPMSAAGPRAV